MSHRRLFLSRQDLYSGVPSCTPLAESPQELNRRSGSSGLTICRGFELRPVASGGFGEPRTTTGDIPFDVASKSNGNSGVRDKSTQWLLAGSLLMIGTLTNTVVKTVKVGSSPEQVRYA